MDDPVAGPTSARSEAGPAAGVARNHPVIFLREFLRHPRQVASITPSSRPLEQRIVRLADVASARTVIELGPGSGGTTRAMLAAMSMRGRLIAIEVNARFCEVLRRIDDPRLSVHRGGAEELRDIVHRYDVPAPDVVVSGIPFSTIDRRVGARIIEAIWAVLAPGGRFLAYQVRPQVERLARPLFGPPLAQLALFNVPPIRVYRWQKVDAAHRNARELASRFV